MCAEVRDPRQFERSLDVLDDDRRPFVALGTADRAFADVELGDRLDKALAQLPPAARFLLSAHYLAGQKYKAWRRRSICRSEYEDADASGAHVLLERNDDQPRRLRARGHR